MTKCLCVLDLEAGSTITDSDFVTFLTHEEPKVRLLPRLVNYTY